MTQFLDFLSSISPLLVWLLVCFAKIVEITIQSLKTVLMVKGQSLRAAALGFVECVIWGLAISTIIGTLGNDFYLLGFYCVGYATGLYLGATLEKKIALGTSNLELIANDESTEKIAAYLKENGKGFTVFEGYGSTGKKNMIFVVVSRKEAPKVVKAIRELSDNHVFVTVSDVSKYTGGFGMVN